MMVSGPGSARPAWYDRSAGAATINQSQSSLAPHSNTQEATYTVPTNYKFQLQSTYLYVARDTAPTTSGNIILEYELAAVGATPTILARIVLNNGVVGAFTSDTRTPGITLDPGDQLILISGDASVGGLTEYLGCMYGVQFDA